MENSELDNVDELENIVQSDTGVNLIGIVIISVVFGIGMGIKSWCDRGALKKEREKNKLYQEVIRKHQAIINELKSEKERRDYKDKLWEQLQAEIEE